MRGLLATVAVLAVAGCAAPQSPSFEFENIDTDTDAEHACRAVAQGDADVLAACRDYWYI